MHILVRVKSFTRGLQKAGNLLPANRAGLHFYFIYGFLVFYWERMERVRGTMMWRTLFWYSPSKHIFVLQIEVDSSWRVVAGEESRETETQDQREMRVLEAIYPRPSAIPLKCDANLTHSWCFLFPVYLWWWLCFMFPCLFLFVVISVLNSLLYTCAALLH